MYRSECPKRFYSSSDLKSHQLLHSDYKHFGCGFVVNGSNLNLALYDILPDVLINVDLVLFNLIYL